MHQGKVRYIGCSTFPAWMVMEALALSERYGLARYVTEQPPYNLLDRRIENEFVPLALRYGLGLLPWSPLAMGMLAGRYGKPGTWPQGSRAARIGSWAAERVSAAGLRAATKVAETALDLGISSSQLALAWLMQQPGVTAPIIGPRTMQHLEDSLGALEVHLQPEILEQLDAIVPPGSAVADFHNTSGWMRMRLDAASAG